MRTKSRSVKKTLTTNSIKEELIPSDQVVTPRRKTSRGPPKKKARVKHQSKPLEIWEIQQSLKRGEFVEVRLSLKTCLTLLYVKFSQGILTVGGGRNGLIMTPVTIDRGRLDWS